MARTGSFGRLPRVAPNLASTIVAMLREYNNMIDTNMVNAWKEGGLVDGKKVTDSAILAHWKMRRDAVSQDDPLWDYYNNMMQTYDYSIAESKMSLKYAQKKIGNGAMAAFYRKWANKLPTDSEGYRTLMRNAAQFVNAARSGASSARSQANENAYQRQINNVYNNNEAAYDYSMSLLVGAAQAAGILTEKEDLSDLKVAVENDPSLMMRLIDDINSGNYPATPEATAEVKKQLEKYDSKGFDGTFDYDYIVGLTADKTKGLQRRIKIAQNTGHTTDVKAWRDDLADTIASNRRIFAWDELDTYSQMRELYKSIIEDPNSTYAERLEASSKYATGLERLRDQVVRETTAAGQIVTNPLAGLLTNEIRALRGDTRTSGHTVYEDSTGKTRADVSTDSDAGQIAAMVNADKQTAIDASLGRVVLVKGLVADGKFVPSPTGTKWGTMPVEQTTQFTGFKVPKTTSSTSVTMYDKDGNPMSVPVGGDTEAIVPTSPITAEGVGSPDPVTGRLGVSPNIKPVGAADQKIGEVAVVDGVTIYGFYGDDGKMYWTPLNPFDQSVIPAGGITLDKDGMKVKIKVDTKGGTFLYDPQSAIDPSLKNKELADQADEPVRWTQPWIAAKMSTVTGKSELSHMSPGEAWNFILRTTGDPAAARDAFNEFNMTVGGLRTGTPGLMGEDRDLKLRQRQLLREAVAKGAAFDTTGLTDEEKAQLHSAGSPTAGMTKAEKEVDDAAARTRAAKTAFAATPWALMDPNVIKGITDKDGSGVATPSLKLPGLPGRSRGGQWGYPDLRLPPPVAPTNRSVAPSAPTTIQPPYKGLEQQPNKNKPVPPPPTPPPTPTPTPTPVYVRPPSLVGKVGPTEFD